MRIYCCIYMNCVNIVIFWVNILIEIKFIKNMKSNLNLQKVRSLVKKGGINMTNMAWGFMLTIWAAIFITEGMAMRRILKGYDEKHKASNCEKIS